MVPSGQSGDWPHNQNAMIDEPRNKQRFNELMAQFPPSAEERAMRAKFPLESRRRLIWRVVTEESNPQPVADRVAAMTDEQMTALEKHCDEILWDTRRMDALERWLKSAPEWQAVQLSLPAEEGGCIIVSRGAWALDDKNQKPGEDWLYLTLRDAIDAAIDFGK